ncbi:unnamed protein product, partial [Prorocentrum cordatum]
MSAYRPASSVHRWQLCADGARLTDEPMRDAIALVVVAECASAPGERIGTFGFHGMIGSKLCDVLPPSTASGKIGSSTVEMAVVLWAALWALAGDDGTEVHIAIDSANVLATAQGRARSSANPRLGTLLHVWSSLLARECPVRSLSTPRNELGSGRCRSDQTIGMHTPLVEGAFVVEQRIETADLPPVEPTSYKEVKAAELLVKVATYNANSLDA